MVNCFQPKTFSFIVLDFHSFYLNENIILILGGFRAVRGCINQILNLKHKGEKACEKKCTVYVGFMDLEKAYDMVNREALWHGTENV